MAQARVTDFFSARKRTAESQPSKRRKLQIVTEDTSTVSTAATNVKPTRSSARCRKALDASTENQDSNTGITGPASVILPTPKETTKKTLQNKTKQQSATRKSRRAKPPANEYKNQISIIDSFSGVQASDIAESAPVREEVTSAWDEHDGAPLTPSKRSKEIESSDSEGTQITRKRHRRGREKCTKPELTPTKLKENELDNKPKSSRKRLVLKRPVIDTSSDSGCESVEGDKKAEQITFPPKTPPAISPLPETPETVRQQMKNVPSVPTSSKVKDAMELVKKLQKSKANKKEVKVNSMKHKLANVGGLEDLKARLADVSRVKASLDKPILKLDKFDEIKVEVEATPKSETSSKKAPAYERFHSLATPAPPTLSLPYRYKCLSEMFRSMDTVISMLTNRKECCTFSKLKSAVQEMTKRNFEEKTIGQVKTVYPSAYKISQIKGLPLFGNKVSGYQLCVEANLSDEENAGTDFTAKLLLGRRSTFHNKLIAIVKKYHKEFLASLDCPLTIPDDKITRWHPKFRLDEVPDIDPAELPKAPVTKSYQTAKDVLNQARGKLVPKMEKALENVASKSEVKEEEKPSVPPPVKSEAELAKYKGIPQSLLEKIRAKENKKLEMSMTRNPEEEKRQEMLQRLPKMMRILWTHFVTEKKPALTLETVVQKLVDSYKSYMATASVEAHMKIMIELLPEWLKVVEIKRGKYLKMDRNIDLQKMIEKVNNVTKKQ